MEEEGASKETVPESHEQKAPPPLSKKEASPVKKLVEDIASDIPFVTAFYNFLFAEGKLVKNGWLAFLIIAGLALWIGYDWRGSEVEKMKTDIENLKRDNQLLNQKNGDLELTIAPLIARAAKEFPGEEINESLKKIVSELAARDPLLTSAQQTDAVEEFL